MVMVSEDRLGTGTNQPPAAADLPRLDPSTPDSVHPTVSVRCLPLAEECHPSAEMITSCFAYPCLLRWLNILATDLEAQDLALPYRFY